MPGPDDGRPGASPRDLTQRALLDAYAPASVLINGKGECLYYSGPTDRYLRVAAGEPSRDLLAMVRDGLRNRLRVAIRQAGEEQARAIVTGARVSRGDSSVAVTIEVQKLRSEDETLLLVSFLDGPVREEPSGQSIVPADAVSRVSELERELDITRKELQSAIRDLEISSEEQTAINEEAMSVNEEFQSTNEELVTSKEELQALNEELTALNSQLQETLERQRSTVRRFAEHPRQHRGRNAVPRQPSQHPLFHARGDSAVPHHHHRHRPTARRPYPARCRCRSAGRRARGARRRRTARARDRSPERRLVHPPRLPYRTQDDRIEGVVITFSDISAMKAAGQEIQAARAYSDSIIDTIREPLVVLDEDLLLVSANRSFFSIFALEPGDAVGKPLATVVGHHAGAESLREFLGTGAGRRRTRR